MIRHTKTPDFKVSGVKYIEKKPKKLISDAPAAPGRGIKQVAMVTNA